jgi:ABC-type antimicrobial peptide transport system permease subunit
MAVSVKPLVPSRTSGRLVVRNLGAVLGRLLAFAFLATVLHIVATMPAQMLSAVARASGSTSSPLKIAAVIWTSGIDTLFFPFWVASMMVLYRSLVPHTDPARAGAPVALEDEYRPATAANAPFE